MESKHWVLASIWLVLPFLLTDRRVVFSEYSSYFIFAYVCTTGILFFEFIRVNFLRKATEHLVRALPRQLMVMPPASSTKVVIASSQNFEPIIANLADRRTELNETKFDPRPVAEAGKSLECLVGTSQVSEVVHTSTATSDSRQVATPGTVPRTRRGIRILDPSWFRKNAGIAGFLYVARNSYHQVGVFKIGQTAENSADARIKSLNSEHASSPDVGSFQLIYSCPVSDSFGSEQALFEAIGRVGAEEQLPKIRVTNGREFFFGPSNFFVKAVQSTSDFFNGNPDALDDFLDWSLDQDSWSRFLPALIESAQVPIKLHPSEGWIYVARNKWHRDRIFKVGITKSDPTIHLQTLNINQRNLTCRLGFFELVYCVVVEDTVIARERLMPLIRRFRVNGSRAFYEIAYDTLIGSIASTKMAIEGRTSAVLISHGLRLSVEAISGRPDRSWAAWARACRSCGSVLRFRGEIGASEHVDCPLCGVDIGCAIGSRGVMVGE